MRKGTIQCHVRSDSHLKKLQKWIERNDEDNMIMNIITNHFTTESEAVGKRLPKETQAYRWRVVETFLYAGIPIAKVDLCRTLLERQGTSLSDHSNLKATFIPLISEREIKRLKEEITGRACSLIFDGTTRLGEAVNFILRWTSVDFTIEQRLVRFVTAAKHLNGDGLYRLFMTEVVPQLSFKPQCLVAVARDSCATNAVAVRHILLLAEDAADMMCMPHTLHNMGKHFHLPIVDEFFTPWLTLVQHTPAAKLAWKSVLDGAPMATFSKVRWWSRWECWKEVSLNFSYLRSFLESLVENNIGDATVKSMCNLLEDTDKQRQLKLELAAILSLERIVKATYRLEGDGLALLLAYDTVEELRQFGETLGKDASDLPSVAALLRSEHKVTVGTKLYEYFGGQYDKWYVGTVTKLPSASNSSYSVKYEDGVTMQLEERDVRSAIDVRAFPEWKKIVDAVKAGFSYLNNRVTGVCQDNYDCTACFQVCKMARLFDPSFAAANVSAQAVEELCEAIRTLMPMKAELLQQVDAYRQASRGATGIDHSNHAYFSEAVLQFWKQNGSKMKGWAKAAQIVFAIPVTSAASERVFSLLEDMFGHAQLSALADYIEVAIMLRFNKRSVG